MWFRLAKELGMSVRRAQEEISSAEFGEWVAYFSLEPFGDRMDDIRMGTIAAAVANSVRTKDSPVRLPLDFVPWAKEPEKPVGAPSPEAVAASVFGINLAEMKKSGKKQFVIQRPKS